MTDNLDPERPIEEGIEPDEPDQSHQEGVHLMANEARERLGGKGFSDRQIFEWAAAYSEQAGGGTVDGLVEYIEQQES